MTYTTAIYKLDRRQKKGLLKGVTGPLPLPKKLPFETIADLMVRGQSVCFHDGNINNDNKNRLVKMFKMKASSNQATVAVLMSMGYFEDPNNMFTANDMGILTIQKASLGLMTGEVIPGNENVLWINEVCRSNFNRDKVPRSDGPIPNIMHAAEDYARSEGHRSIFLMVEQNPEHGDGSVLLQYYGAGFKGKGGYGYQVIGEGDGYWYMMKDLSLVSEAQASVPASINDVVVEAAIVTPSIRQSESNETMMQNLENGMDDLGAGFLTRKHHKKHHRHNKTKRNKKHHKKKKKHGHNKSKHHKKKKKHKRKGTRKKNIYLK